jgi:hypothetical protein
MAFREIENPQLRYDIPQHLRDGLQVLNAALDADPEAIRALIGTRVYVGPKLPKMDTPIVMLDDGAGSPQLGPLGLLNAFSADPFRLAVYIPEDEHGNPQGEFTRFIIVENLP